MLGKQSKRYDISQDTMNTYQYAKIQTNKGDIWIKLHPDDAPNTVANFAHLANEGFYNTLKFHRVIPGFMAQGGCPHSGPTGNPALAGTGGPDWQIDCETDTSQHKHGRGSLSMAHAGPNTGGSQFFICFASCPHLDGVHTVFGAIEKDDTQSFMVLDNIEQNDIIETIEICTNKE
ncbi:MAG: peptidylprolyl isomerase [Sulfurovum sp.]|nr:peptidylprolyl isomerase [Sulfurovum sp.]MCB4745329.1 peptidylprolyl isomerase [Sulfurovum sp.]MCB4750754.1 peptidylprolyl isomerase [Sulfurovum sp.]MCB4753720.1 peptidylprolyl isomerase [Sulfurovum sp.]MCB4755140.1 peptidylprolyl isomerase [Sulfurovum sp.]